MPFRRSEEITEKQAEVWTYLVEHVCEYGYQPSMTEMAEHFGVTNKAIRDRILHLAAKGYVEFSHKHADRCLRLRNVRFQAVFQEDECAPVEPMAPLHPVRGPEVVEALKVYFNGRDNQWATIRRMEADLEVRRGLLAAVLKGSPDVFERTPPEGGVGRWRLKTPGKPGASTTPRPRTS